MKLAWLSHQINRLGILVGEQVLRHSKFFVLNSHCSAIFGTSGRASAGYLQICNTQIMSREDSKISVTVPSPIQEIDNVARVPQNIISKQHELDDVCLVPFSVSEFGNIAHFSII